MVRLFVLYRSSGACANRAGHIPSRLKAEILFLTHYRRSQKFTETLRALRLEELFHFILQIGIPDPNAFVAFATKLANLERLTGNVLIGLIVATNKAATP